VDKNKNVDNNIYVVLKK